MLKAKRIIQAITFTSMVVVSSPLLAESYFGLSYAPSAKGKKVLDYQFDDTNLLKVNFFKVNREGGQWGYYGSIGTSTDDGGVYYDYTLLTVGATRALGSHAFVFLGGGYSWEAAQFSTSSAIYRSVEDNDSFNANLGIGYSFGKIGVTAEYDSAPKALSVGLSYSF